MKKLFFSALMMFTFFAASDALAWPVLAQKGNYQCVDFGAYVCTRNMETGQCTQAWSKSDGGNAAYSCKQYIGIKVSNYDPNNYYCKQYPAYVCAVSKTHGQCTQTWDNNDGNPMYACQKYLGLVPTKVDKSNYRCVKTAMGSAVCAQNIKTGQCTHTWTDKDGDPMFACKKFLGQ